MKKLSTILGVLFIICVALSSIVYTSSETVTSVKVSVQHENSEKGQNPDKTSFDYKEMIFSDIIQKAFELADVKYESKYDLAFEVNPVIKEDIMDKLVEKKKNNEVSSYYPSEYIISIKNEKIRELSKIELEDILKNYGEAYNVYFNKKYSQQYFQLSDIIQHFDYSLYDYSEYNIFYEKQYSIITNYLLMLAEEDPNFKSSEGNTFNSLKEGVALSETLDLKEITSMIDVYKLSKDKALLITKYKYMIDDLGRKKNKSESEYTLSQELLGIIKQNETSVIIPSEGNDYAPVATLNDSYDTIAEKTTLAKIDASSSEDKINYYKKQIEALNNSDLSVIQISSAVKKVDSLVEDVQESIKDGVTLIEETSMEYFNDKYSNDVSTESIVSYKNKSIVVCLGMGLLIYSLLASVVILIKKDKVA